MNDNNNDNNQDINKELLEQEASDNNIMQNSLNDEPKELQTDLNQNISAEKPSAETASELVDNITSTNENDSLNDSSSIEASNDSQTSQTDNTGQQKPYSLEIEKPKKSINKKVILVIFIVIAIIASAIAAYLLLTNKQENKIQDTKPAVKLMGAELSIIDGIVQTSKDNVNWIDSKVGDQIAQGTYVRTQDGSRAVIALDDGSAVRVNSNSVVKMDDLNVSNVAVTNVSGTVYTRIVKSDRSFSVNVANESYVAMGTAYITQNTSTAKGVEVYESNVKIKSSNLQVPEGKLYYTESSNNDTANKLADIPIEKLKQDAFLAWNYQQDKAMTEFKDKLGYLTKMDAQPAPTATPSVKQTTASSGITLSGTKYDTGVKLVWSVSGVAVTKGFKVVKGLSANPIYGKDEAVYISDSNTRSYAWTLKDGKTYNFRVCTYTGDSCTNYSNNIAVTAPKVENSSSSGQLPAGSLNLVSKGGNNVGWTLTGSAPYGYKLVWSKTTNPVYPGNDYQYYSSESTRTGTITPSEPGPYYVRVCMYNTTGNGDKCLNYSNQITIP